MLREERKRQAQLPGEMVRLLRALPIIEHLSAKKGDAVVDAAETVDRSVAGAFTAMPA